MLGKKFLRGVFVLLGILCGAGLAFLIIFLSQLILRTEELSDPVMIGIFSVCMLAGGIIFFLIEPAVMRGLNSLTQEMDQALQKVPVKVMICGTLGLLIGLILAFLVSQLWAHLEIPLLQIVLSIIAYVFFGYLGVHMGYRKSEELTAAWQSLNQNNAARSGRGKDKKDKRAGGAAPKILDTSIIIDGRIVDIMKTGFIEGKIIIPEFVLVELRHIADSSDSLKRVRGRRGLDVLNKMQSQYGIEIYNTESEKRLRAIPEVDVKLLELASMLNGKVVTNDYNLNKVADIKGVPVLNINELANTMKPVVLPGEEMDVTVVREGKESNQGLAYLDDGTMIVVEDGRKYIGEEIHVTVTSVLQTSAGRMIFARKG